jgi:hypothetical protein
MWNTEKGGYVLVKKQLDPVVQYFRVLVSTKLIKGRAG